ncbi:hypothetical protein D3C72_1851060 [compost metagenome]
MPVIFPFQAKIVFPVVSNPARKFLDWPPIEVNCPPTNRVVPESVIVLTTLLGVGVHAPAVFEPVLRTAR